jgi:hypothetical protein
LQVVHVHAAYHTLQLELVCFGQLHGTFEAESMPFVQCASCAHFIHYTFALSNPHFVMVHSQTSAQPAPSTSSSNASQAAAAGDNSSKAQPANAAALTAANAALGTSAGSVRDNVHGGSSSLSGLITVSPAAGSSREAVPAVAADEGGPVVPRLGSWEQQQEQQELQQLSAALLQQLSNERRQLQQQLLASSQQCAAAVAELGCLQQQLQEAQNEAASKSTLVESLQQQLGSALVRAHLADCWRALASMKIQLSSALGSSGQQLQTLGGPVQLVVLQQALLAAQQGPEPALPQQLLQQLMPALVAAGSSPLSVNPTAVSSAVQHSPPAAAVGAVGSPAAGASVGEATAVSLQMQQLVAAQAAQMAALQQQPQQQQQQLLLAGLLQPQQQQPSSVGLPQELAGQQAASLLGQRQAAGGTATVSDATLAAASQVSSAGPLPAAAAPTSGSSLHTQERRGSSCGA